MRVCLFEDQRAAWLEPLSLARPVFDLLCGQTPLRSKQCRHFAPCAAGVLVRPYLADLFRLQHPSTPVNDLAWLRAAPAVLVNGRWLPPAEPAADLGGPCVAMRGDEVAYAVVGPDKLTYCSPNTIEDCVENWKATLPHHPAGGHLITHAWDLVEHNSRQLHQDFRHHLAGGASGACPAAVNVRGSRNDLVVDPTAQLDPHVVVDTTQGPVGIDREAVIHAFTRLEGPCYVGPGTQVLGARIRAGTTLGPNCRIGGEVEASIVHGHSNKYHDGFLGHSYVGEWVNLGAGTHNSDLRNDYGEVTVAVNGRPVPTGRTKVGCFLGDHTKTGLGTLLNTGTNVGLFCNLLPAGRLAPKYVPSFLSWWDGSLCEAFELTRLLATARTVMGRRGCVLTDINAALFGLLHEQTAPERARILRDPEHKQLRRSA
jgi:UDP-N-acetylglucosamine diphosphorylase/glucosamine-1-phosphate N-acetyltransferase